jgi:hypothetical protein
MYGGVTLLGMLAGNTPGYLDNPLRQNLWRGGHRKASVIVPLTSPRIGMAASKIARICEPSSIRISESLFLVLMAAATAKGLLA